MNSSLAESQDKTKPLSSKPNHVADQSPILPKQQILEFHKLVSKIYASLITVANENLDAEILRAQEESLEPLGVDRGGLLEVSEGSPLVKVSHIWFADGIDPVSGELDLAEPFPWSYQQLVVLGKDVIWARIEALPPEAQVGRADLTTKRRNHLKKNICWFGLLIASAVMFAGCAASGMKSVETTGFLGDYSQLQAGVADRAALFYVKPGVNLQPYDKIMFDRVVVMLSDDAEYRAVDPAVLKELTDYYQKALFDAVQDGYQVVDQLGPGVLRVRVAITGLKPSKPVANTMSTIIPVGMVAAGATKAVSGDNLGTGEASTEFELLDSLSGERLAAAVDRRQGGKSVFRGKWEDSRQAFDFWAKRFRERLDEVRGK